MCVTCRKISTTKPLFFNVLRPSDNSKENMRVVIALDFHPGRKSAVNWNSYYLTCFI